MWGTFRDILLLIFGIAFFAIIFSLGISAITAHAVGERVNEIAWPDVGNQYFYAESGGDAASTEFSLNNYNVINLSLTETFDIENCFNVISGNEVCYTCVHDINVNIAINFTSTKATGTEVLIATFALGIGATTTIDDGDEEGEEYQQIILASTGLPQSISILKAITLSTDDCAALIGKVSDITGGSDFDHPAVSVAISEF